MAALTAGLCIHARPIPELIASPPQEAKAVLAMLYQRFTFRYVGEKPEAQVGLVVLLTPTQPDVFRRVVVAQHCCVRSRDQGPLGLYHPCILKPLHTA